MSAPLSKQEAKPFIDDLMSMGLTLGEWRGLMTVVAIAGGPARAKTYIASGRAQARGVAEHIARHVAERGGDIG